jgi:hypothetical protein
MKSFKIGDTVHYMESNIPQVKTVVGKATLEGEVKTTGYSLFSNEKDEPTKVILLTGSYSSVDSDKCFSTLEELKQSLFPSK